MRWEQLHLLLLLLLTQHQQRQLVGVDAGSHLDFALVGGRVRLPHVRDGDGGVARRGAAGETEPGRDGRVSVVVSLASSVGQDLEGGGGRGERIGEEEVEEREVEEEEEKEKQKEEVEEQDADEE